MLFASDQQESSLYKYVHEFLEELQHIKQAPEETTRIQQRLQELLERQGRDATTRGGEYHANLYRQAQYLMVAFADELFLHLFPWEGRRTWQNQLLELKMFKTQVAGQKVFDDLDTLLNQRDRRHLEVARLYLIILALGFEGKYRTITETTARSRFNDYRKQLFRFITQREPENLPETLRQDPHKRIFPEAYTHTLDSKNQRISWFSWWHRVLVFFQLREPDYDARRWLPPKIIWWQWLLAAVLVGFLVSGGLWMWWTTDLYEQAGHIVREYGKSN